MSISHTQKGKSSTRYFLNHNLSSKAAIRFKKKTFLMRFHVLIKRDTRPNGETPQEEKIASKRYSNIMETKF